MIKIKLVYGFGGLLFFHIWSFGESTPYSHLKSNYYQPFIGDLRITHKDIVGIIFDRMDKTLKGLYIHRALPQNEVQKN
jgi:hypothetical protein